MREILFRAKRIDNGEWVEGNLITNERNERKKYIGYIFDERNGVIEDFDIVEVMPNTICQYTGLKDKNGNRIFEGDIFEFDDETWESSNTECGPEYDSWDVKNYGAVGYCDYSARFDFAKYKYNENSVEADLHENNTLDFVEFVSELEVCGNIFDNPELLKGE